MLKCPECGEENQIGRVFCASCGGKLNLADVSHQDVQAMVALPWWRRYWKLMVLIPVAIVLLVWGMRLWPKVDRIGVTGNAAGRMRVTRSLERVRRISEGEEGAVRSAEIVFSEADINAYLRYDVERDLGVRVSVDLSDGMLMARVVRARFSWNLPKDYRFEPDASYDLACGMRDKMLVPYKVWIGHTSAGLSRRGVARELMGLFGRVDEGDVLALAEKIELRSDELVVQVRRR
jgi:hypothetical protein